MSRNVTHLNIPAYYVRDNHRVGGHYTVLMHDVEAKNHPMRSGGWLPPQSAFIINEVIEVRNKTPPYQSALLTQKNNSLTLLC